MDVGGIIQDGEVSSFVKLSHFIEVCEVSCCFIFDFQKNVFVSIELFQDVFALFHDDGGGLAVLLGGLGQEDKVVIDFVVFLAVELFQPFRIFQHHIVGGIYLWLRGVQLAEVFR